MYLNKREKLFVILHTSACNVCRLDIQSRQKPIYLSKRKKREKTFHHTRSGTVVCNGDFTYQRAQVKSKREEIEAQTEHTDFATHLRFYFPFTWSGHWELDKVHSCHFVIFIVNISPFLLFGDFHFGYIS